MTEEEKLAESMYLSAQAESHAEIQALKALNTKDDAKTGTGADFDPKAVQLHRDDAEEIISQLDQLDRIGNDEDSDEVDDDDSELEAM